jgi:hypothetical protein
VFVKVKINGRKKDKAIGIERMKWSVKMRERVSKAAEREYARERKGKQAFPSLGEDI